MFTHSFADRASAPRSAAGWNIWLGSLLGVVDRTATALDAWRDLYERYVAKRRSDGTFTRYGESAEIGFERSVGRALTGLWKALTKPERLGEWSAEANIDLSEDGRIELRFGSPASHVATGVVTREEAPKVLEYSWRNPGEPDRLVKPSCSPLASRPSSFDPQLARPLRRGGHVRRLARSPQNVGQRALGLAEHCVCL